MMNRELRYWCKVFSRMRAASVIVLLTCIAAIGCSGSGGSSAQNKINQIIVWEDQGYTANGRIFAYLFDDDESVRLRTALALGRINDTLALDTLRRSLLEDKSPQVRAMSAFALAAWQWQVGKDALLEAVERETDPDVLLNILQGLARCYAREEHGRYIHLLRHPDPRVRAQTALTLDQVNWRDDADSIVILLDDEDPDVRKAALFALGRMRSENAARRAVSFCDDPDPEVRRMAYRLAGSARVPGAGTVLLRGLSDPVPGVRAGVAEGLLMLRDTVAIMEVLPYLLTEKDPRVVRSLARTVGMHWREDASGTLMQLRDHPDPGVRIEVTKVLCNRRDLMCSNLIAPAATDADDGVRYAFCEAVDQVQRYQAADTSVILPLLRGLCDDPSSRVRARAVQSLSAFADPEFGGRLNRLFNDEDIQAKTMAINLIGSIHIQTYVDSLHALYRAHRDDPRPELKWAILAAGANMLPTIHIDSTRQDLLDWAMADPNRLVRWYAIAVGAKFRKDLKRGLGVYQTDLTPDNVDELLFRYSSPPKLRLNTTRGTITIELDTDLAPRTARRLIALARAGVYNDMPINNAQVGQAIQTGDRRGDGFGLPPETVRDEYSPQRVARGSVFWLMQTRDAGRGTFGMALTRLPYLDWRQPVIGRIVEGIETADALTMQDTIRTVDVIVPGA